MTRRSHRASRTERHRRLPPPAANPGWEDSIDRTLAQMLTSPDPLQRAIAAHVILSDTARSLVLH